MLMGCTKETIVEPIKYNVLIVGGHKEHLEFNNIMFSKPYISMINEIEESIGFGISDLQGIQVGRHTILSKDYPTKYLIIMIKNDNDLFILYDAKEIFVDVNVLTDSLYQGHIWGTVYNGPDILNIELHFKIELGI